MDEDLNLFDQIFFPTDSDNTGYGDSPYDGGSWSAGDTYPPPTVMTSDGSDIGSAGSTRSGTDWGRILSGAGDASTFLARIISGFLQSGNFSNYGNAIKDIYGSLAGSILKAGQDESGTMKDSAQMEMDMFNQMKDLQLGMLSNATGVMQPWATAGNNALAQITSGLQSGGQFNKPFTMQDFYNNVDPSYGFRKQEGINSLAASGAANGSYGSGAMGAALQNYGQNLASMEYANAFGRYNSQNNDVYNKLFQTSGQGYGAAQSIGNWNMQAGQNIGSEGINTASAMASQYDQAARALAQGQVGAGTAIATGGLGLAGSQFAGYSSLINSLLSGVSQFGNILNNNSLMNMGNTGYGSPYTPYTPEQSSSSSGGVNPMSVIGPAISLVAAL